ncbi:MAG: glycosyltransferase [Rubrivivax sp.]|nr:glycosyltransferase [Rubrivivax sp.]
MHRARHLVKHLGAHGWEPTVITVDARHHAEVLDPALRTLVPASARIVETGALPMGWTAWLGLRGEIGLRGWFHLRAELARQIESLQPSVVLITGSPFYPMLLSRWIQRRYGVPVVLDLQDPWASKEGTTRKRWTKGWLSHQLAVALEPRALSGATWVTSVSERQNADLCERYDWLDRDRMSAIPIGGDPEDFAALRVQGRPDGLAAAESNGGDLAFSYVGTALPHAAPLLSLLFEGLAQLRRSSPDVAARIRVRFVGTSNQPGHSTDYRVRHLAEAAGVADLVSEQPGRVGFLDALRILATSHAVLMIGSDEPHYTASKIYPGLMSGRPFFSLYHEASSAHAILSLAGGGISIAFRGSSSNGATVTEIAQALRRIAIQPETLGTRNTGSFANYTATAVAGQFAAVFDKITKVNAL